MNAVVDTEEVVQNAITFANMSGDITLEWDSKNDEKIKELVRKKMAEGYTFFTMRKVVIDSIKVKRKIGAKGVDSITNLIIDDATFEKLVKGVNDKDVAGLLRDGTSNLAKRRGSSKTLEAVKKLNTAEEVVEAKQSLALRPIVGG